MQLKLNKILVPVDFSEVSMHALDYAAHLARNAGASMELLHVVETYKMNVALLEMDDIDDLIEKKARDKMNHLIENLEVLKDLEIDVNIRKGKIKRAIVNFSKEDRIDLIVMGTTGVSGDSPFTKHILGSNAHRVIQASHCPVITVPSGGYMPEFSNVVLPLDLEKQTTGKVDSAIKWAKTFKSTIHLLSIFNFFDEYRTDVEDLKRELSKQADRIHKEGIEVMVKSIRYADVADAVLDYAEDNACDLIIIMTRQESKMDQIFLGSRARDVIVKSKIPVLSIRPR